MLETKTMINKNIAILFSTKSETNLVSELNLIDFIQQFKDGRLVDIDKNKIKEQVDYVYQNEPNVNTYREEQIREIFNVFDYNEQNLLLELIYFLVGEKHNEDIESVTIEKLDKWGDCVMQHGFYLGYQLCVEKISKLLKEIDIDYVIRFSRDVNFRGYEWENLCKYDFNVQLSDEEIIANINIYNDGAYTTLPESVETLLFMINRNQYYDQWIELYKLLTYVPLQGRLIYSIQTIEDCLAILRTESKKNVQHRKVFAYLMRKRIFDLFIQEQDLLERNIVNENLNEEQKAFAASLLSTWNENKQIYAQEIVTNYWKILFNIDDMLVWLSVKHCQTQSMRGIYKKRHEETLRLLGDIVFKEYDLNGFTIEDKKLSTILYYISHMQITDKGKCNQIVLNICNKMYTEEHLYLPWQFDEDSLNEMRAIYTCLSNSDFKGEELTVSVISQIEPNLNPIRMHQGNKWWLSVLMLKTEESENCDEFMCYADLLMQYAKDCDILLHEYYLLPFLIAEIVSIEVINEVKDIFEKRLIEELDDIIFIVSILTLNNGTMNEDIKAILRNKVQDKWEKSKIKTFFKKNIEICEKYLQKNELM